MKKQNILVTGGTGFLGSYLLRYLVKEGYTNIRALCRPESSWELVTEIKDRVEWVTADLLDLADLQEAMIGIKRVYHCAAVVSFDPRDRLKMYRINQEGTANIVNLCLHYGIEKLVHVSSIAAIGRHEKEKVVTETTKWQRSNANTHYAITKYLAEQEVWRGMAEGLSVGIVNPSVIFGSGYWDHGPLKMFGLVDRGFPFYSKGQSGFVDVRDVAKAMIRLMESEIDNERFIINGENRSYRDILNTIAKGLHRKQPNRALPLWIQQLLWRLEWLRSKFSGKRPLFTRESVMLAGGSYEFKNEKSKNLLNMEYTPIDTTIAATAQQYLETTQKHLKASYLPLI
ncbi:MAG: NAD-dependent epimerase [Saprospiraceae bacterium]|nr:MAG: NAD-dependent epimerase [Saprospiraceae bacterium]